MELGSSDAKWEESKKNFQITDPSVDAQEIIQKKSLYESQIVELGTQILLHDYLNDYINDPNNLFEIIPVGLGGAFLEGSQEGLAGAESQSSLIAQHNTFVNQRKVLLKSMSEKALQVQRLTASITELQPTLKTAMNRERQNLVTKKNTIQQEYAKYMGRVSSAPQMERVLTEIGRQREIKQGVYLLLLQKREETAMTLANITNKGKLIEEVQMVKNSKHPKKLIVLLAAFVLGLIFPMPFLFFRLIFKTVIDTKADIDSVTTLPLIGEIPFNEFQEAIRTLRTNLLYSLGKDKKVVLVISDSDGDGKTIIAQHLADSLSYIGKKAKYWDLDLRHSEQPVHPADYLAGDDFSEQVKQVKAEYDYVIVDTPSLGKYSDAYQISQFADATIYLVKAGTTRKSSLKDLDSSVRFPYKMIVLNDVNMSIKKKKLWHWNNAYAILLSIMLLASCASTKNVPYFINMNEVDTSASIGNHEARIMPKDLLQIRVFSSTPEAAEGFNLEKNLTSTSASSTSSQSPVYSYLVDKDGNISFPVLGTIHLGGLTISEAEHLIKTSIVPYMSESEDFFVHVRMMNYKYSVLGEVRRPGTFNTQNEQVSVVEAIAQAGDLTLYGLRDKVYLIRTNSDGRKEFHQLNLNDANIVSSPYYYLQQNDIVYVEPNKAQARNYL